MKKPNKAQRHCLIYLRCVWFFLPLFVYNSFYNFSNAVEKGWGDNQDSSLTLELFTNTDTSEIANRCSGTYLSEKSVLTAAHCFNEQTKQIVKIKCPDHKWQTTHLLAVRKHHEMDVAIAHLSNLDCNIHHIRPIIPSVGQHLYVYKDGNKKVMTIGSIDSFTFKVNDSKDCLIQGDSGMMAYATPLATEEKSRALGILISGQPTCPAIQTFLRFDLINQWLLNEATS